jgi:UDP-N-acetylmuramyl pentapeptide synthase
VLNADAPELTRATQRELAKRSAGTYSVVRFGSADDADLRISGVKADGSGVRWMVNGRLACAIGLLGEHNAWNATAALAVGRRLGLSEEQIVSALATAKGPEMRMQRHTVERAGGTITVINDAYNANPESMLRAFEAMGALESAGRRVVVMGEMLELGIESPALHAEVGRGVARATPDVVVCVGAMMEHAARVIGQILPKAQVVRMVNADGEGAAQIAGLLKVGDLVLLKGSRRMGLERVLKVLEMGGVASVVEAKPEGAVCAERSKDAA